VKSGEGSILFPCDLLSFDRGLSTERRRLFFPGDLAAGGELCDSAGKAGCPRERIEIGTEMETYEFMNVPQIFSQ